MSSDLSIAWRILGQAWPILFGQFAAMAFGVVDTIMTGHSSPTDLAAMGLGASIYGSVFVSLLGVVNALNPIIAYHHGAGSEAAVGASYVQGLWLALLVSAVGCPVLALPELWLPYLDVPSDVRIVVTRYLRVLALALPAALMFRAVYALNVAVSRPKVVMSLQIFGLVVKVALSGLLIFGHLGLPRLGAVGCAVASAIVYWAMFLIGWAHVGLNASYRRFAIRFAWPRWSALKDQLRLGIPMGLSYALESTSFTFMALLIARLGTTVMGGHQIVMNLAALSYQIPLALAVATATVTAQAIGAGDLRRARTTAFTGLRIGLIVAAATSVAFWTFRDGIVGLYTSDAAVAGVALSLIGYVIAFHVFDALQGITAFVLRAYRIAVVPTVAFRLIAAALRKGINVNVFAYEGAVSLTMKDQAPHANPVKGTTVEEEDHPTTKDLVAALVELGKSEPKLAWVNCGLCVDERGAGNWIEGVKRGGPADFYKMAVDSTKTVVIPTK